MKSDEVELGALGTLDMCPTTYDDATFGTGPDPVRLNLGAGETEIEGFESIDRKLGTEVYPLEVEDNSVDEIRASHVLEHFGHSEIKKVLQEWVDKLKPGGLIKLAVPDFQWITHNYNEARPVNVQGYLMGGQMDENDYHKAVFDREVLTEVMIACGLENIKPWISDIKDCAALECSLNLMGTKPSTDDQTVRGVAAILAAPRFSPTLHSKCAFNALGALDIRLYISQGCFWHQTLSEAFEKQIAKPETRYVLTLDYDTIFVRRDVLELYRLMERFPEADAICAMQSKRGDDKVLFGMLGVGGDVKEKAYLAEFSKSLTKLRTAHFGLTIFRADSLRNHPRPYMVPIPDEEGRWGDGRVDADMNFWKRWHDEGKTIFLANRVVVGHMEEMIVWPGAGDFKPIYQPFGEYVENGVPPEAFK